MKSKNAQKKTYYQLFKKLTFGSEFPRAVVRHS